MFETNVNKEFSLKEKTGLTVGKEWKSPYILYCYKELISNQFMFDGKLELQKINEDRYILKTTDSNIDNNSIISVLVMESDEIGNIPQKFDSKLVGDWKNIEIVSPKFKRYKYITVNKDTDFIFNIKDMNINPDSMQVMFFIEDMPYLSGCHHIKMFLQKIDNFNYKVILQQKFCDTQNVIKKSSGYNNTQQDSLDNVGSFRYEIDMESNEENVVIDSFFKITLNDIQIGKSKLLAYCGGGYVSYCSSLTPEIYVQGKNKKLNIKISPQNTNLTYTYKLFYYTTSNKFYPLKNYSLKVFILGDKYE